MQAVELAGVEHGPAELAVFAVGWLLGWLLLWRTRPLPTAATPDRRPVAVVVPARDEAANLPYLLGPLVAQRRPGDEIVVVDDRSDDGTAEVARRHGATVVAATAPPTGWLGKPHACRLGADATTATTLVFLDADVRPGPHLLDDLAAAVDADRTAVTSVQPWHEMGGWSEQASVLCNVTALMGCGAFTVAGRSATATVAFGPVLAVDRHAYDAVGGHGAESVRTMHTEDIALARAVGRVHLYTGAPDTRFRMYPDGLAATVRGWTRSIATGARFTPWWLALATLAWVWSLAGGWIAAPAVYPLSALQVWVLGRRAGNVHPLAAAAFPVLVAVFVVIFVRSLVAVVFRRDVSWKGRSVAARPGP